MYTVYIMRRSISYLGMRQLVIKQSRTQSLRSFWREALDNANVIYMIGLCCFLPQYPNALSIVAQISNKQLRNSGMYS